MEGHKEKEDIGEWVRDVVERATESMEFEQLNQAIRDTVNAAIHEVKTQTDGWRSRLGRPEEKRIKPLSIRINWVGRISGILFTIFGGIGSGVFGILTLVWLIISIASPNLLVGWWLTGMFGAGLAGFLIMLGAGVRNSSRISRLKKYLNEIKHRGKTYCELKQLNRSVAKSLSFVQKDVKKMLDLGMLPDAHMDDGGTCLILDEETYRQYRMAQASLAERQGQERPIRESRREPENSSISEALSRGEAYMDQLDQLRDAMPGEPIREKLLRLDTILERLFLVLKKHPDQMDELERFMEYYLPTTVKLVTAYQEFSEVEFPGENINQGKQEIEETLETINDAFEKLLDDIYEDTAFDVLTDVSVLQSMLARDGLTEPELRS